MLLHWNIFDRRWPTWLYPVVILLFAAAVTVAGVACPSPNDKQQTTPPTAELRVEWEEIKTRIPGRTYDSTSLWRTEVPDGWVVLRCGEMIHLSDPEHVWLAPPEPKKAPADAEVENWEHEGEGLR